MKQVFQEQLMHYVWKHKLYPPECMVTDRGEKIKIIDPGLYNRDAGPDFFNAKIVIDNILWAGDVEVHLSADDWYRHKHHLDKAYNSVILHLVAEPGRETVNQAGDVVPQVVMIIPSKIAENADFLLSTLTQPPCRDYLPELHKDFVDSYLTVLALERLERKTNDIYRHLKNSNNSWDEVFYILLCRNFGFDLNSDFYEQIALSLPLHIIQKHSDNLFQIEALLFGQAGLLIKESVEDDYLQQLSNEYSFLKQKYGLKPVVSGQLKWLRVRPQSFPTLRLAQMAAILFAHARLFSEILEIDDLDRLRALFKAQPSEYWQTHYSFGKPSKTRNKAVGDSSVDIILINTVASMIFAYGKKMSIDSYCDRAFDILKSLKPERNSIVSSFTEAGLEVANAMDSQAFIQLKKEYCDKRKCLFCRIGHQLLAKQ